MVSKEVKGEKTDIRVVDHHIYGVPPTFTLHAFIIHQNSLLEMQSRDLISYQNHKLGKEQVQVLNNQVWLKCKEKSNIFKNAGRKCYVV